MRLPVSILLCCTIFIINGYSQKLPFQNYGVDKGLIQSQVQCITEDDQRHIWIGTVGGLDRFDGTDFQHFSKTEGLNSSSITALYKARNGFIWAGTFRGVSSYDGFTIRNYPVEDKSSSYNFNTIAEDDQGVIWAFGLRKGLFNFQTNRFVKTVLPFPDAVATCIYQNQKRQLVVNFYQKGLYLYEKNSWRKINDIPFLSDKEIIVALYSDGENYFGLTNKKRLLKFRDDQLLAQYSIDVNNFGAFCRSNDHKIWIGTNKGVMVFSETDLSFLNRYGAAAGVSDNFITDLFPDSKGNMWIGTDGDGIFRFSGGAFSKYDSRNGLPGNIVMGVVTDRSDNLLLGIREGGLIKYDLNSKQFSSIDYSSKSKAGINCMANGYDGRLLIGTLDYKLLSYNGKKFGEIRFAKKQVPAVNTIASDANTIWLATTGGCYYLDKDSANKVKGINEITSSVLPLPNKETLIGSADGVYLLADKNGTATKITNPLLRNVDVNCLVPFQHFILVGTVDNGVLFWDRQKDTVYACNKKNGLTDNFVFDVFIDKKNTIWVGTATGIQQVAFNEANFSFRVKRFSKSDGYENSENNLNAMAEDKNGKIWIGTTKGVFIYDPLATVKNEQLPYVVIQDVSSPGFKIDTGYHKNSTAWYHFPRSPVLSYAHNSINFTVKGIFLRDPDAVQYAYQLQGKDTGFSQPTNQVSYNYQSLEPGDYVFKIKAVTKDGLVSENIAEYPFSVEIPFRKSKWFLMLVTAALILTGVLIQIFINRARQRKLKQFELFRQNEQEKIRQRTSEDFHDELGNKLTRVSLLADILQKKAGTNDAEQTKLINQIKENVQALYAGTKDVIWSLSPVSDNFSEILKRIQQFGEELFQDAEIHFSCYGFDLIDPSLQLPIDYSRNIIMICKELLNNSLRHSNATEISITVEKSGINEFAIIQKDNGAGFNPDENKNGNGLNNIRRRAERIHAEITWRSTENKGSVTALRIKIP